MEFERLDALLVAAQRHSGPHLPDQTDAAWEQLILWAAPRRMLGRSMDVRGVGLLWDSPTSFEPSERRYDVGIPIDVEDIGDVERPGFVLLTMPGEYLKVRHSGRYDRLPDTYDQALGISLQAARLQLVAAPIIEIYRNSPAEVDEDDLVTDVYFPVVQL
jgi:DNA gyrase inhibitor GyrI